jgi:hypothetical protein
MILGLDTGECDQFEGVNLRGVTQHLGGVWLLTACVKKPYNGEFTVRLAHDGPSEQEVRVRWVAVAADPC